MNIMSTDEEAQEERMKETGVLNGPISEQRRDLKGVAVVQMSEGIDTIDRFLPQIPQREDAVFVISNRRLEYVNEQFTEVFGITSEEAYSSTFDFLSLIAPENRHWIGEKYKEACISGFAVTQIDFIGLTKKGHKIACKAFLMLLPLKWGFAIRGTMRLVRPNI
jgi:PAS domain-containing protein